MAVIVDPNATAFHAPPEADRRPYSSTVASVEAAGVPSFSARIAMNIGISLRAVFSAAARGPLVLVLWLGHSSIASMSRPALRSDFTYDSIGLWNVQVYTSGDAPGRATIGLF